MAPGACQYCGRQNDAGAQFCSDCGKPLTKAAAARAAVASGGGGSAGESLVSRTSGPAAGGGAPADGPCPLCGSVPAGQSAGAGGAGAGHDRRIIPDRRSDYALTLVLISEIDTEVARFVRKQSTTTIGRTEGDIRFPEDQFLSPLHAKLSWEEGRLEVRDLGSRNGTWAAWCRVPTSPASRSCAPMAARATSSSSRRVATFTSDASAVTGSSRTIPR